MSLIGARIAALITLFFMTLFVGTVPVFSLHYWRRRKERIANQNTAQQSPKSVKSLSANKYVQILTQTGGGVLFFTVLMHMLPEIKENYEIYLQSNRSIFRNNNNNNNNGEDSGDSSNQPTLPYVELTLCVGFFLIYMVEEVMHKCLDKQTAKLLPDNGSCADIKLKSVNDIALSKIERQISSNGVNHSKVSHDTQSIDSEKFTSISYSSEAEILRQNSHLASTDKTLLARVVDGILIVLPFSVHSLFDGISIGIQSNISGIWTMFIAIASHKLLIAFILSVELCEKCANLNLVSFYMTLFSVMSPIGILVVIVMEESISASDGESNPIVILLSALSAGTILYIVMFEMLQRDRVRNLSGIVQFATMLLGFSVMFAISTIFTE